MLQEVFRLSIWQNLSFFIFLINTRLLAQNGNIPFPYLFLTLPMLANKIVHYCKLNICRAVACQNVIFHDNNSPDEQINVNSPTTDN